MTALLSICIEIFVDTLYYVTNTKKWRFYRTSSEIVEEIILFQTTILSHTVLHSPDKYSQATNVQTSDIVCNKQLEIGCHEHCSSAI